VTSRFTVRRPALEAAAVTAAMVLFALFAHRGLPWSAVSGAGLLATAALIGTSLRNTPWPAGPRSRVVPLAVVGIAIGALGGVLQRQQAGALPEPATGLQLFVLLACLIGITEELVYRGWMLGRLGGLGWPVAVAFTALSHAAYKTALFSWPPDSLSMGFNLAGIALWTVAGGMVLGVLRVASRSVLPAVLAHAVFDAVVYSAFATPPWWVWG